MRRASVLVAVTAVSLVIASACTSFPELSLEEGLDGADGSPGGNGGDDGGGGQGDDGGSGGGNDGSSSTTGDGGSTATDSSVADGASGNKDGAPGLDAAADTGPDACAQANVDCSDALTQGCEQCVKTCKPNTCNQGCCAIDAGPGDYMPCCYSETETYNPPGCSAPGPPSGPLCFYSCCY